MQTELSEKDKQELSDYNKVVRAVFEKAIETGRLSADPKADNYAGKYMYMGKGSQGKDTFKHIMTRKYIS